MGISFIWDIPGLSDSYLLNYRRKIFINSNLWIIFAIIGRSCLCLLCTSRTCNNQFVQILDVLIHCPDIDANNRAFHENSLAWCTNSFILPTWRFCWYVVVRGQKAINLFIEIQKGTRYQKQNIERPIKTRAKIWNDQMLMPLGKSYVWTGLNQNFNVQGMRKNG